MKHLYTKQILLFFWLLATMSNTIFAQFDIPRMKAAWNKAGVVTDSLPKYENVVNVVNFRVIGDGTTINDNAFKQLLVRYEGTPTIFYFPPGKYLFNAPIHLTNYFILKGASSKETELIFDLKGKFKNCINAVGSVKSTIYPAQTDVMHWSSEVKLNSTANISIGDMVLLTSDDDNLVESDWAANSTGQISRVDSIVGQSIFLSETIRRTHPISYHPEIQIINPVKGIGIECLKVRRKDATPFQTTNIYFKYALNGWVSGVEGHYCNYAHVEFRSSYHLSLLNSYFQDAFDYGNGGKGYGALVHFNSSLCLVENNIFDHLRHAIVLQAGANGNVIGYNYSHSVYWENEQGSDKAGDLVLHGNYPYANLFESNVVQNIIADDSHGMNGIYNVFTRNRAENYGIFVSTTFPATPEQIFDGNETIKQEDGYGRYGLFGYHLEFGNNIKGSVIPAGTFPAQLESYYKPNVFPKIGLPYTLNEHKILAQQNFINGQLTTCLEIRNSDCPEDLSLTAGVVNTGNYKAAQQITTIGNVVIANNASVVFGAGESVVLEEGFVTGDGADFTMTLQDCNTTATQSTENRTYTNTNSSTIHPLSIAPNPMSDYAWLKFYTDTEDNAKYLIYNQQGVLVQENSFQTKQGHNELLLDLQQLSGGFYVLVLVMEQTTLTTKIMLLHPN